MSLSLKVQGKCCICGTVRNCGPYLEKVLKNIEIIGNLFEDYRVVFSYDESSDNSLQILTEYQSTRSDKCILHVGTQPLSEFRVHNIARARNQCLDTIRSLYGNYEYFIMIDCDNVASDPVKIEHLLYYLTKNTEWDSLSFNKTPFYYDIWALSKYPYSLSCMHFNHTNYWGKYIEKIIYETPPGTLISCLSAFNGFAIYRTNKFIRGFYDPTLRLDLFPPHMLEKNEELCGPIYLKGNAKKVDCEHRSFHLMAINADNTVRIRIAPEVLF